MDTGIFTLKHIRLTPHRAWSQVTGKILALLPWRRHCGLATVSRSVRDALVVPGEDELWGRFWDAQAPRWGQIERPSQGLKRSFLAQMRRSCVECGVPTPYVFVLASRCRLCEQCERSYPKKYSLVTPFPPIHPDPQPEPYHTTIGEQLHGSGAVFALHRRGTGGSAGPSLARGPQGLWEVPNGGAL